MTIEDKGKKPKERGCVLKATKKEVGFDLELVKEKFMQVKKSFVKASTSGGKKKLPRTNVPTNVDPSVLTTFLETCTKLLHENKAMKGLKS